MAGEFDVHRLNAAGLVKAEILAGIFRRALAEIDDNIVQGRERALVVTKLQEACFFAKRAIALDPANLILTKCAHNDTSDESLMCTPCWEKSQ